MERTLDMKFIRYLNLFEKITKVRTQHCFCYNLTIIFLVPKELMAKALGEGGRNMKSLSNILEKKVKVITAPLGEKDMEKFILAIIYPLKIKGIEVRGDSLLINAGMQSKAALIGRNKIRLLEMKNILQQYFGIKYIRIL